MKYFLIIFYIFLWNLCYSQSFPEFESNPIWHILVWEDAQSQNAQTENFSYIKDTSFCDKNYSVFKVADQLVYLNIFNEKVDFKIVPECNSKDYLLYDFSAEKGDTLYVGWNNALNGPWTINMDTAMVKVDSVFYQEYNGIIRKTLYVITPESIYGENWIRGIGSDNHPFYSVYHGYDSFELYYDMLCYDSSGVNLMINDAYNTCDTTINGDVKIKDNSEDVRLYPNPIINKINIEGISTVFNVKITDLHGKIVFKLENINQSINVENLNQGAYIISITDSKNNVLMKDKFIKL